LAGLESGEPSGELPSAPEPVGDVPPEAPPYGRGVLVVMRGRRSIDPVVLGRFLLILGSLGVATSAAVAVAHFVFGVPLYEGRQAQRLASDQDALGFLLVFAAAFAVPTALGILVLRDASDRDATNDLVR
jgi:hypothetical protein